VIRLQRKDKIVIFCLLFLSVGTLFLKADIIYLKNNRKISGKIIKETDNIVIVDIGIGEVVQRKDDISHIERERITDAEDSEEKRTVFDYIKGIGRSLGPRYSEGRDHYIRAKDFVRKRDSDNAILELEQAIEAGYKDGYVYGMLGSLYKLKGDNKKARKYLTIALEMFEQEKKKYAKEKNFEAANILNMTMRKTEQQLATLE